MNTARQDMIRRTIKTTMDASLGIQATTPTDEAMPADFIAWLEAMFTFDTRVDTLRMADESLYMAAYDLCSFVQFRNHCGTREAVLGWLNEGNNGNWVITSSNNLTTSGLRSNAGFTSPFIA
jgi:hypothetical protein